MGLKPSAPKAPDYAAAAKEQGEANVNSALATNYLNQPNQVGPTGSLTYSYGKTKGDLITPAVPPTFDKKGRMISQGSEAVYAPGDGMTLPDGTFIPRTTVTTTLSPEQQKLYDQDITLSTDLNDLAIRGTKYVDEATKTPLTADQFKKVQYAADGTTIDPTRFAMDASKYKTGDGTAGLKYQYDFSKAGAMPSSEDFTKDRDLVTQALMARMQPQLDQDRQALDAKLANQGINLGSQAFGDAQFNQERGVNDARLAALLAGSQEQQRMFGNAMGIRQQGVGEAISQGDFNNSARGQAFQQRLAANNQNFGQASTANRDNFQQQMAGNLQNFNMGLAQAQQNNASLGQDVQMADFLKNQPLNMLNALRTGNQVMMPEFGNRSTGAQVAAAPIYAATNDAYNAALQKYQTKAGMFGDMMGGLAGVGSAAITASDRKLKKNIRQIGRSLSGLAIYAFDYLWNQPAIGFMADEVEKIFPDAVYNDPRGFKMVDYGRAF